MADQKISALPAATTPLAGTEVLPIVQSSTTRKVAVSDLTAGRAISATAVTASTGNFIVGTAGKGIDFSASPNPGGMTSELLADYEEGTWSAVLTDGPNDATMGGGGTCYYTKIGRLVNIHGYIYTTSLGSVTGNLGIRGLPFASSTTFCAVTAGMGDSLDIVAGNAVTLVFTPGSTAIAVRIWSATTGTTPLTAAQWTANGEIMFSASYFTAS